MNSTSHLHEVLELGYQSYICDFDISIQFDSFWEVKYNNKKISPRPQKKKKKSSFLVLKLGGYVHKKNYEKVNLMESGRNANEIEMGTTAESRDVFLLYTVTIM